MLFYNTCCTVQPSICEWNVFSLGLCILQNNCIIYKFSYFYFLVWPSVMSRPGLRSRWVPREDWLPATTKVFLFVKPDYIHLSSSQDKLLFKGAWSQDLPPGVYLYLASSHLPFVYRQNYYKFDLNPQIYPTMKMSLISVLYRVKLNAVMPIAKLTCPR